jgi:hypothetical protein
MAASNGPREHRPVGSAALPSGSMTLSAPRGKVGAAAARQLNERPRKTLNYETLAERFAACISIFEKQPDGSWKMVVDMRSPNEPA